MTARLRAIRRALDVVGGYHLVQGVRLLNESGDLVEVDFKVPMPSRWIGKGASPTGVRPVEPVRLTFEDSFPLTAPKIELRADFNRSLPHLQPGKADELPQPCLFEGDKDDLFRYYGMVGVLRQAEDWLGKASAGALIDLEQGWEPVRRDTIDDYVEVAPDFVRGFVDKKGGFAFATTQYASFQAKGVEPFRAIFVNPERCSISPTTFQASIERASKFGFAIILWAGKDISGSLTIASEYKPETVFSMAELFRRAADYTILSSLRNAFAILASRFGTNHYRIPLVVSIFMVVRRPADVIGQGSPLEVVPYVIEVQSAVDLTEKGKKTVRPAAVRDSVSRTLLANVSGTLEIERKAWTLLGCGSIGSKIALHLARQGLAPAAVSDRSILFPHNFARHALVPRPELPVPGSKAILLARDLDALGQLPKAVLKDFVGEVIPDSTAWKDLWPKHTSFLLDATGSPRVADSLCLPHIMEARPRTIETCLLGGGSVGYIAVEGPAANPSVLDLQTESFRLVMESEDLREKTFLGAGDVVVVGQGCSSRTAQMSDAKLSVFVPAMAQRVSNALREGLHGDMGDLALGFVDEDLMNQYWQKCPVPAFRRLRSSSNVGASISQRVISAIDLEISAKAGVETGGVLIGRYNEVTECFHIVDVVPAPPDSRFTASEFTLGMEGLAEELSSYVGRANGTLYPVGTWHNHLAESRESVTDLATAAVLALGQKFPVILLIRTPGSLLGVVADADRTGNAPHVHIERLQGEK